MAYNRLRGSSRLAARPHNVEQITKAAQTYEYSGLVPLRYWLRTAATMLKEAEIYEREGDDEQAYLLLFRHAHLVLTNLAVHPDAPASELLKEAKKDVQHNLEKLDKLNPRIKKRYERFQEMLSEREARRLALLEAEQSEVEGDAILFQGALESDNVHHLEGGENRELAVQLAQHEMSRRATERKATREAGISQGEERVDRAGRAGRVWEIADNREPDDLSRHLQEVRAQVERPGREVGQPSQRKDTDKTYAYPLIPLNHAMPKPEPATPFKTVQAPDLPPKPSLRSNISAPPLPEKLPAASTDLSTPYDHPPQNQTKQQTLPLKATYTFKPSAYLENGNPLRTLFLPPTLRHSFLSLAHPNTERNLETCAFLAGTLLSNALFVSKLIFPRQTATSDTCEMTHESDLFDYIDSFEDLMILGWIHTHPRQTCFMSSRDLHTHAGYQMMLPESVAVVCAPSQRPSRPSASGAIGTGGVGLEHHHHHHHHHDDDDDDKAGDWGVFRLTDPPGKGVILACSKPGVFHPHDCANIYTDALRPGHVVEARGLEFDVVDLR